MQINQLSRSRLSGTVKQKPPVPILSQDLWVRCPWHASSLSKWVGLQFLLWTVLLTEVILDLHEQGQLIHFDHVEGEAFLPKAACPPYAVQVGLVVWLLWLVHREIKVHNDRDLLHINPWKKKSSGGSFNFFHRTQLFKTTLAEGILISQTQYVNQTWLHRTERGTSVRQSACIACLWYWVRVCRSQFYRSLNTYCVWLKWKRVTILSADKDAEQLKLSYIADGNEKWCSPFRKQFCSFL